MGALEPLFCEMVVVKTFMVCGEVLLWLCVKKFSTSINGIQDGVLRTEVEKFSE